MTSRFSPVLVPAQQKHGIDIVIVAIVKTLFLYQLDIGKLLAVVFRKIRLPQQLRVTSIGNLGRFRRVLFKPPYPRVAASMYFSHDPR